MAPTPVVHDLEALDAEPRCNLGCAYEFVYVNAATHARMLPHSAYMLTHPFTLLSGSGVAVSGLIARRGGTRRQDPGRARPTLGADLPAVGQLLP